MTNEASIAARTDNARQQAFRSFRPKYPWITLPVGTLLAYESTSQIGSSTRIQVRGTMGDLYIDNAMLRRVRKNLSHIDSLLEKPAKAMESVDAKDMGASELEKRMESFGDEWDYGIKQLKKFSQNAVKALDKVEKEFSGFDQKLAKQLSKAAKKK
ncbi:hypothetical protein NKH77_32200 [Streptomyces sp. M19]